MKCIFCDNEFEQKQTGRTPKFCSAKCRVYFNRSIGVGEKIVELQKNLVPTELVEEEIDARDVNKVTGEVYDTKEDKLAGLRAMMDVVNEKHEGVVEPLTATAALIYHDAGVPYPPEPLHAPVYESSPFPGVSRPYIPRPNVPQPAKREVVFEEGDKIELVYEDNPL